MKKLISILAAIATASVAFGQASVTRGGAGGLTVQQSSLVFTTPVIGAATGTSLSLSGAISGTTGTFSGVLSTTDTTQATNGGVASLKTLGGIFATKNFNTSGSLILSKSSFAAGTNAAEIYIDGGLDTMYVGNSGGSYTGFAWLPASTSFIGTPNAFRLGIGTAATAYLSFDGTTASALTFTSRIATGTAPFTVTSTTNVPNLYVARATLADSATTNANLTGPVTSSGNATSLAAKADVLTAALYAADAGSTDDYAITLTPAITAYVTGTHYWFKANTVNTGAATININSVGAKTIVKVTGGITTTLATNDIRAGQWVDLVYDGTNMQMQSLLGNAAAAAATLTSTYAGYGDGSNVLTGEAAYNYTAATNTLVVGAVSLGAGGEVSQLGPFVDAVDGTTPLNNINQVVAAGTAYTMTASYASLDFGTTDPILTIANAGTYAIYVNVQFNLVGATYATYDSVTAKLRRTNNTAADLTGSTFGTFIPTITTITAVGPYLSIGPIKYTTANTNDTVTVQAILGSTPSVGSVTATAATITAIRAY